MQGGDDVGDEVGQCLLFIIIVVSHGHGCFRLGHGK
jgi:hypothetical protein